MITPGSSRDFYDALDLAGLPHPVHEPSYADFVADPSLLVSQVEKAELFLRLLVEGIDFCLVGDHYWRKTILSTAPDVVQACEDIEQSTADEWGGEEESEGDPV